MKRTKLIRLIEQRLEDQSATGKLDSGSFVKLAEQIAVLSGWRFRYPQPAGRPNSKAQQMSQAHRRILKSEAEEKISKMTLDELYIAKTQEPMPGLSNDAWKRMLRAAIKKLQPQQPEQPAQEE